MSRYSLLWISLILLLPSFAAAQTDEPPVTFDFTDVDIRSFIKVVSELTGRNYVIDPAVSGKITVTSPQPIPKSEIPSVFQAVLDTYGYSAVEDGEIIKIIPAVRAKQESVEISVGPLDRQTGIVTRVVRLKHVNAAETVNLIAPLISRSGHIAVHSPSNTLVMTDSAKNADRLMQIIGILDESGPDVNVQVLKLNHAPADSVATLMNTVYGSKTIPADPKPFFAADTRSNTLLIVSPRDWSVSILEIIRSLDEPLPAKTARIRVIHLKNADAVSLADILNRQINQLVETGSQESRHNRSSSESDILIGADPAANALIVAASPEDLDVIEAAVNALDTPRRQVWVEALVIEISQGKTSELGVEWRLTDEISPDEYRGFGGTNLNADGSTGPLQQTARNPFDTPSGLVLGIVKGTVSIGGVELANIAALARAMESTSGVNILSTPHLLTLDNEEAEIIVGEERPFLKNSQTLENGAVVRTYEFKDIGLTLRLTPRITEDGQIVMKIFQEIKNFVAESDIGAVTSTKRQARTTVRVSDGQMVAIGGLLKEDEIHREMRVPCLGTIPGLAYLFRSTKNANTKTNLLIFIAPHIIESESELESITEKYKSGAGQNPGILTK